VSQAAWLVLLDQAGIGARMVEHLTRADQTCLTISFGAECELGPGHCTVRAGAQADYRRVAEAWREQGLRLRAVVHLGSVTPGAGELGVDALLDRGLFSLAWLVQALAEVGLMDDAPTLVAVSNGAQSVLGTERLLPGTAPVVALCRSIARELPIRCLSVDVDVTEDLDFLARNLVLDAAGAGGSETVAYRMGYRWTDAVAPIALPLDTASVPARLESGATYVITGGLGGLGLTVARFLAGTVRANLVLVGRTGLPPREAWASRLASQPAGDRIGAQIRAVQELESLGAQVQVHAADVTDREAMEAVAQAARRTLGTIRGVFHAAGVPGGTTVQLLTREDIVETLAPKVAGTLTLESVFRDDPLDFLVLFSSVNAVCGFAGTVDDAAANAFLDAYAAAKHSPERPVVSVAWDAWRTVGMVACGPAAESPAGRQALAQGLEPEQGIEALRRILDTALPHVLVTARNLPELVRPRLTLSAPRPVERVATRLGPLDRAATSVSGSSEPATETERIVARLWQEVLGVGRVGRDDNFFDLGGHSLAGAALLVRIHRELKTKLPLRALFEHPTVRQLAERIAGTELPAPAAARIEQFEI
jgi:NAD(P)-dependent dehydrogenase (short-subunit alcohol dehydrogenase family)/acyl carrier protein